MNKQRTQILRTRVAKPVREVASWKTRKSLSLDVIKEKDHVVLWRAK
jgi:hypothetical protein